MVDMSSVGAKIGLGFQTVAAMALNKSDNLNSFVNWISGGSVNRNKLAETILHKVVELGVLHGVSSKALGERTAVLVPLMREALVDNDMSRMKAAVADLASEGLSRVMDKDSGGLGGFVKGKVDSAARTAASTFAERVVGDHAVEKAVTTLVKEHGWTAIDAKAKAAGTMANFAYRQVKDIIQHGIVDNPAYDQRSNPEYRAVAGLAHQYLSGEQDYAKPLREYAPTVMAVVDTAQRVAVQVPLAIDSLQEQLGSKPQAVDARSAFASVQKAPERAIGETTTARDLAQAMILESVLAERAPEPPATGLAPTPTSTSSVTPTVSATVAPALAQQAPTTTTTTAPSTGTTSVAPSTTTPTTPPVSVSDRLEAARLSPGKRAELEEVADQLSAGQLKPLGARSGIEVAQTWSGALASVQAHSHLITNTTDESARATVAAFEHAPVETTDRGGYEVGAAFGRQVKNLTLALPASSMGYTDSAVEGGRALYNTGWSMLGFSTGPDLAESSILKQVYNCCGQDADVMSEATRFLDPAVARDALVMPTMRSLGAAGGEVLLGDTRLQLARGEPAVIFQMASQQHTGFVAITVSTEWNVSGFGKAGDADLRTPLGNAPATMTASATIHIHPAKDGLPQRTEFFPLGVVTSISNTMSFDRASGETV